MGDTLPRTAAELVTDMLQAQAELARQAMQTFLPGIDNPVPPGEAIAEQSAAMQRLQALWLDFLRQQRPLTAPGQPEGESPVPLFADPARWLQLVREWARQLPFLDPDRQQQLTARLTGLWEDLSRQFAAAADQGAPVQLPRADRRFAAPEWREQPAFAMLHQSYLLLREFLLESIDEAPGLADGERESVRFATGTMLDALSPANFPLTNPQVLQRTLETGGENLRRGMERLAADLERGQLTHTDSSVFRLGETIAATPGQVVHETELYQLIQYTPTTPDVLATPLVIFPPWINRFYILDLNPKKSFVRWAVAQGLTVFMVSWRSADESLTHVEWDHYVRAQIEVIEHVRARLAVPAVHTVGYCVAGTTLAATLAVLARRGQSEQVASATFLTAQVDFEAAGELKLFIDQTQMEVIRQASKSGYMDGRYLAATFNLLRAPDLIWNTVVNHYLLAEDYPAFDLLHWNGDVTNLPALWHESYLRNLYRDNLLVVPDRLEADGTPIDLTRITVPVYVQAGREDHIAPPASVFRMLAHVAGPTRFVLAGSGHIAGVVNPPESGKYQFWIDGPVTGSLEEFVSGATEVPGSWWNDWATWITAIAPERVAAEGSRDPAEGGLEAAPGRYVAMR
ncbi:poly(R)-hydroxyalkanoic acid synthase [Croceibacterium mercuriale]|uniref:Poly(R)-hydroxyalkanoic acid synthase n=1 Tax=Croceibacterium mercuriale TaxID=1572751 RepID=A0A0B2BXK9_9SPHN|nr:alpha/beta fold hydrolase [Croceibacterium mercuriale]KHL24421.1 poly(R)-hydroxyalkanoic acid synthase [Croceibacterium mercuriale]